MAHIRNGTAVAGDRDIATFARPPVVEVVASVHVAPLPFEIAMSLGSLWRENFRAEYPVIEPQAPLAFDLEDFSAELAPAPAMQFRLTNLPEPPRIWFMGAPDDRIVQVQNDWFACNWRKVREEDEYSRWSVRRASFMDAWDRFRRWLSERDVVVQPLQCEVSYINHIDMTEGAWAGHEDLNRVFAAETASSAGLAFRQRRMQEWFDIRDHTENAIGRLEVSLEGGHRNADHAPIYALQMTARTEVRSSVEHGLDAARAAVVHRFVEMTSSEAHEAWGMQ